MSMVLVSPDSLKAQLGMPEFKLSCCSPKFSVTSSLMPRKSLIPRYIDVFISSAISPLFMMFFSSSLQTKLPVMSIGAL